MRKKSIDSRVYRVAARENRSKKPLRLKRYFLIQMQQNLVSNQQQKQLVLNLIEGFLPIYHQSSFQL